MNQPLSPDAALLERVPAKAARRWQVLPLARRADGTVEIAVADDRPDDLREDLAVLIQAPVATVAVPAGELRSAIEAHYGVGAEAIEEGAVVKFVDELLLQAHRARATDIHIEPFDREIIVRIRVDGLLQVLPVPPALLSFHATLVSRIKVMAQMNIAEKRLPQDGRFRFAADGQELDVRVSTVPTIEGESVDLRLLPRSRTQLTFAELGMPADVRAAFDALIHRPNGILLVTGPTGHGKTTTLYASLSQINTPEKKIVTIEDPAEVRLRGVNQVQVHPAIGLTFAAGLRSTLRQDPDVIMVGEIRDAETAEIAIRAALTGHLVFSTLHTNDAVGAVTRLVDMGIEPYLVAASVNAVLAQRLIRLTCAACGGAGQTCGECRGSGFHGRTGLFELLMITEEIRALILARAPASALRDAARRAGMRTLAEDGRARVAAGLTTDAERRRVAEDMP